MLAVAADVHARPSASAAVPADMPSVSGHRSMRAAAHGFAKAHMAIHCCAEPNDFASSVITKEEVEARGSGTREGHDTYDSSRPLWSELRVFFTGGRGCIGSECPEFAGK